MKAICYSRQIEKQFDYPLLKEVRIDETIKRPGVNLSLTDVALLELLQTMESDRIERKESAKDADKICQAICAFANDMSGSKQPGVLFIGIADSGAFSGLEITDQLLQNQAAHKTNGAIQPIPSMVVEKRMLNGHAVAVIVVAPSDMPPVRYEGRIWVRTGPRRSIASEQD
jgi:ATP-dependent DNA helicase RecG